MSLQVACKTLRDVILERKGPKDVVLAVHRLNQTLLKARTFAEAEDLVTGTLLSGWKGGKAEGRGQGPAFLQVLVDIVVTGKPKAYPVLCLLHTFSLFKDSSDCLCRLQVPIILKAVMKGRVERVTAEMANKVVRAIEKQEER